MSTKKEQLIYLPYNSIFKHRRSFEKYSHHINILKTQKLLVHKICCIGRKSCSNNMELPQLIAYCAAASLSNPKSIINFPFLQHWVNLRNERYCEQALKWYYTKKIYLHQYFFIKRHSFLSSDLELAQITKAGQGTFF